MTTACAYCMGWEGGPHANNCPNYNPFAQALTLPSQFNNALRQQGQLSNNYNQGQTTRGCVHNGDGRCPNYCGLNEPCKLEAVREIQRLIPVSASVWRRNEMTSSDLGIVDELLDDKVGMELP